MKTLEQFFDEWGTEYLVLLLVLCITIVVVAFVIMVVSYASKRIERNAIIKANRREMKVPKVQQIRERQKYFLEEDERQLVLLYQQLSDDDKNALFKALK